MKMLTKDFKKGNTWVTVSTQDIIDAIGLSESAAQARLHKETDWHKVFKKKGQHGWRTYLLSDGNEYTIEQLQEISGINRNTLYNRLHNGKNSRNYEAIIKPIIKKVWEDKKETIIAGIVMDPSYLDGVTRRNEMVGVHVTDRYGKAMPPVECSALMQYRDKLRKQWLKEKKDTL